MVAWLQSWDNFMTPEDMDWTGLMTLPRELHVEDDSLVQLPVREIENYYTVSVDMKKSLWKISLPNWTESQAEVLI